MSTTTSERDLPRLRDTLKRVGRLLDLPEDTLRTKTEVSGWCAIEHLFHVTLANEMSLKNARNLVDGRGRLRTELPDPSERDPRVTDVLVRGRLPHGAKAPRFVAPPPNPDLGLAREFHAEAVLAANTPELERAGDADRLGFGVPHQILGVLTAAEWLRFARMHSAHHLRILARVLAAATGRS